MDKKGFDYTVSSPVKVGQGVGNEEKTVWVPLGVAWKNQKDGSISVNLNGLPINGKLVLFIPKPKEEQKRF